jgi:hypothetical protein
MSDAEWFAVRALPGTEGHGGTEGDTRCVSRRNVEDDVERGKIRYFDDSLTKID